jgi:hypothetical protein
MVAFVYFGFMKVALLAWGGTKVAFVYSKSMMVAFMYRPAGDPPSQGRPVPG